jgi:excinuclease ABC subunit A
MAKKQGESGAIPGKNADQKSIEVVGARTHNLKGISCSVRLGKLTVVTGVSGSGKSSFAFDTLYAEGQRRYVASMSTYARQFLEKIQRPDVDAIHNIPPAIALEQKNSVTNARSTIGTATEINDYLRLLFARVGHVYCRDCDCEVRSDTPQSAAVTLDKLPDGKRLLIVAPVRVTNPDDREALDAILEDMRRQGFTRALTDQGEVVDLESFESACLVPDGAPNAPLAPEVPPPGKRSKRRVVVPPTAALIFLVVDRVVLKPETRGRLAEALELAFRAGGGRARVRDADSGAEWLFSSDFRCDHCGRLFRKPEPALFSFSSPLGACPTCQGFGRTTGIDLDKAIPNWDLSLREEPVVVWNSPVNHEMYDYLRQTAPELPLDKPLAKFSERERRIFLHGNEDERPVRGKWCGVLGFFKWLEGRRYKIQARVMLARYRAYNTCPDCQGTRLVPDALDVRVDKRNIAEVSACSIAELHEYFDLLRLPPYEEKAAERLLQEIRARLHYLDSVGLGYLTLARQTRTLSGGESQRINLATALGSSLTETLYVLDEPTVGLHSRDTFRLLQILQALRESGNTVVVVEHDPDVILGADDILDIGPAAGEYGGKLLYAGSLEGLAQCSDSATARFLAFAQGASLPSRGRKPTGWITVRGAREHNLKNLDVRFPRGVLCCVTGVSGSGKSTLVTSTLFAGFRRLRDNAPVDVGAFDRLEGIDVLEDILMVDQKPIGRSARSNPVTYIKAYDSIRALFASTREARHAGIKPGDFSFNVEGGRCETCQGAGVVTLDMHFLADVEVTCDDCDGKRFQRRVLAIEWQGKNIDAVLDLTVQEAREFFASEPKIVRELEPLELVGLGYLRLGQSTATLSGGEAQRLKLAGFLAANRSILRRVSFHAATGRSERAPREEAQGGEYLMIFDEPTTGLHPLDLDRLVQLFHALVDGGVSILVVEHNLDLIAHADWVVDLGPEGGDAGGHVVAEGPPARIMETPESHTGRFLKGRYKP